MCFKHGQLPHVPPPPPPPPTFSLSLGTSYLISDGKSKTPITLAASCKDAKHWGLIPQPTKAQHVWLAWESTRYACAHN
jgi:hypothetical protein